MTHTLTEDRRQAIGAWLAERLSPYRYQHSLGVAATARRLAERYGADADRAELAGLLHDVAREWKGPALLEAARELGLSVGYLEEMAPMPCLHGPVGSAIAKSEFGLDDQELLAAIAHHTMGREAMGTLERVVFLADAIEPNRPDADYIRELRALAEDDLNRACLRAYDHTFLYLIRNGQPIHPDANKGRNWLIREEKEKANHE